MQENSRNILDMLTFLLVPFLNTNVTCVVGHGFCAFNPILLVHGLGHRHGSFLTTCKS